MGLDKGKAVFVREDTLIEIRGRIPAVAGQSRYKRQRARFPETGKERPGVLSEAENTDKRKGTVLEAVLFPDV